MPSISFGPSPQSFMALRAASAWSWICDRPGMTPRSVVSAAPTTATDFCFMGSPRSGAGRLEQRQRDVVVLLLEGRDERHVENQGIRRLRAADDVGHHARAFVELDNGDRVGRGETRR